MTGLELVTLGGSSIGAAAWGFARYLAVALPRPSERVAATICGLGEVPLPGGVPDDMQVLLEAIDARTSVQDRGGSGARSDPAGDVARPQ
jgi:hypothetical protein